MVVWVIKTAPRAVMYRDFYSHQVYRLCFARLMAVGESGKVMVF